MKLIFATGNEGKMREIRMLMQELNMEIQSMKEAGVAMEIQENGATFEENAGIKARAIWEEMQKRGEKDILVMADDSGLEVDAMGKEPGVHSSRFMGEDTSYEIKNQYILDQLQDTPEPKRTARFVCCIATVYPDGKQKVVRKTLEGTIAHAICGENGFGYDPIFCVPEFGCTTAELSLEQKNKISHRGKALEAVKADLKAYLEHQEAKNG